MLRALTICLFTIIAAATAATAQERPRAILVMDGSGSMWGQIDGKAKITIAQEVVGTVLGTIPDEQELGLTLYGHRRKGDCADIETVVQPATGTKAAIQDAVNAVSPKGKTPMTEAVKQAAEALRYTEEKATVILVSDGIETCDPDPCAAARALEAAGVDFTAHVIGFDVSEAEALRQMQCIADETGGTFLKASNAEELAIAMVAVVDVEEPEPPAPEIAVTLFATAGESGPRLPGPFSWQVTAQGTDQQSIGAEAKVSLAPGRLEVTATRASDGLARSGNFLVRDLPEAQAYAVVFPAPIATITFRALEGERGFVDEPLSWEIFKDGAPQGTPALAPTHKAELPDGPYTVRATRPSDGLSRETQFTVEGAAMNVMVTFPAPPVSVRFRAIDGAHGPSVTEPLVWDLYRGDTQVEGPLNAPEFTSELEPGEYRVTVMRPSDEASAEAVLGVGPVNKTVTVELPEFRPPATLEAEASAIAGSTIPVRWTGPDGQNDYISVNTPGAASDITYSYTREGSPLDLLMPPAPGSYELRYHLGKGNKVLATRPIEITDVSASVTPPAALPAGGKVMVGWTGPDYQNDYIALAEPGAEGSRYLSWRATQHGSPAELQLPAAPGRYELRYVMRQSSRILAAVPVEITAVTASVTPPAALPAGSAVKVGWEGPDDQNDYIAIFPDESDRYSAYAYTRNGSPAELRLPAEPGRYRIAYVQRQGNTELASVDVEVTAVTASVTPPAVLPAGASVDVAWEGPDDQGDYIAIFAEGADRYAGYTYTRHGSPAALRLPAEPGRYRIAYVQDVGNTELASVDVEVTAVTASVTPPAVLPMGGVAAVEWTGPNDQGDYIAIFPEGESRYTGYAYTRNGTPAQVPLPARPGRYRIAYVQDVGNTEIASVAVEVTPVTATIAPPQTGEQGATVPVPWEGPDFNGDYIAIFPAGEARYTGYAYTRNGTPAQVPLPATPGAYELAYVLDRDNTELLRVPITVTAASASLAPQGAATAGGELMVAWEGPDNASDYIAIFPAGSDRYSAYAYTRNGSPARIKLPEEPGDYLLKYVLDTGDTPIAEVPITVKWP